VVLNIAMTPSIASAASTANDGSAVVRNRVLA
jgi:hypothetical protein